jgi:DNA-binding NarL/FixJ family response regulator
MSPPYRLAIVNDYEMVVAGVAAMLAPYRERVVVVELDSGVPTVSDVDAILYDTFGQNQGDGIDFDLLLRGSHAQVVVFSWNVQEELVERALAKGARGYLSKSLGAEDIVAAVEAVCRGEVVRPERLGVARAEPGSWPGREHGLSAREAEVIALITQGLSNAEIAERSYLSINSVKTFIRSAYRKMGVTRRAPAVVWGMTHGFEPDRSRIVDTAEEN